MSPAYKTPRNGAAALGHQLDDRPVYLVGEFLDPDGIDAGHGGVAPHPARVRPLVAVEDALVVLGRSQRHDVFAVAKREQRELLAVQELLHDDLRLAESALGEKDVHGIACLAFGCADDHALARGQAVGLEHERVLGLDELLERMLRVTKDLVRRGGHASVRHQLFCVDLRPLQTGRLGGRAEGGDAGALERIHGARDERRFGSHHD